MLYRGTTSGNYSSIGAATSRDGHHFRLASNNPAITAAPPSAGHGVEDPRLYYLDGKYYAFFTRYYGKSIEINEAVSKDALHWRQLGPVLDNTENPAVVADPEGRPVEIDGHYLMYYGRTGRTYLARSTDLLRWTTIGRVNPGFPPSYDSYDFCVAVTDYQTLVDGPVNHNIDLFVAGTLMAHGRWHYAVTETMFRRSNLHTSAAQLKEPVLYPQTPYEKYGFTPNTVFMNSIFFYKNSWWMYYGAGDSVVALANAGLRRGP